MALRGEGGMLPRKILENVDVLASLELFEQFSRQIWFNFFLPPTPSSSPNMIHFVPTFSIYACLRRKDHCHQRGYQRAASPTSPLVIT